MISATELLVAIVRIVASHHLAPVEIIVYPVGRCATFRGTICIVIRYMARVVVAKEDAGHAKITCSQI